MARSIVRLKDIADKTGFSTNTVSLALRQSPRIPQQTRDIIQRAASELNYLPNQIAKSLVSRETKTIGLVLTDITNPTLTHTAQAIEKALAERGYGTLFATSNNTLSEEIRAIEMVRARQVDGILIYPTGHRQLDHLRSLRRVQGDTSPNRHRAHQHCHHRRSQPLQRGKARGLSAGPRRSRHRVRFR